MTITSCRLDNRVVLRYVTCVCMLIKSCCLYNVLFLLSTHADSHVVDISFTVCLCVCVCVSAGYFVRDILGVGWRRAVSYTHLTLPTNREV